MAPHWKCGSGQPVAGSNPALSATSRRPGSADAGAAPAPTAVSFASRARRGTSGALYLQSAPAGLNPLPRSPFSNAARRATLRTGSRAAANREPCQVRKEAALSDHRRVPRNGLVRAARHGGHGDDLVDGGCTAFRLPRAPRSERRLTRPFRTRPSTAAGAPRPSARSSARTRSSRRCATPSGRTGSAHAVLFVGPRGTGKTSLARILAKAVNCTDLQDGDACDALPVVRLDPRGHDARPRSRSTRPATAASMRSATCASACPIRPAAPTQGLHPRRGPPDHEGRLERAPQVDRGAARLRRSSCSPRPSRRASRRRSSRASSATTSAG